MLLFCKFCILFIETSGRTVWASQKITSILPIKPFGHPFVLNSFMYLDCIHGGEKRIHKLSSSKLEAEV